MTSLPPGVEFRTVEAILAEPARFELVLASTSNGWSLVPASEFCQVQPPGGRATIVQLPAAMLLPVVIERKP